MSPHERSEPGRPPGDAPPAQVGLVCRDCGCAHFYTLYTLPVRGGMIRRRKACRHCGRRITTRERIGG